MSGLMSLKSSDMQKMGFTVITGAHPTKSCPGFTACPESGSLAMTIFYLLRDRISRSSVPATITKKRHESQGKH